MVKKGGFLEKKEGEGRLRHIRCKMRRHIC